jgi:hypothetical protein
MSVGWVAQLGWARMRHRPWRWLLLSLGVALALALPVLSMATGRVVAAQALTHAVDQLAPGDRTVVAAYGGALAPPQQSADDVAVRRGLARLTSRPAHQVVLYGTLADTAGDDYRLAASDALEQQMRITSGRAPTSCTTTRCEVVLAGTDVSPRLDPALGLVVVGRAVVTDPLLLPGTFAPGPAAHLLLGSDPVALQRLSRLEHFPKAVGWVAPLDTARILAMGVPAYADLSRTVGDDLGVSVDGLVLAVPDDVLLHEDGRASASQGRFAVLGGASAVLVLGFVMVAAAGLRREHREVVGLVRRRGASPRQAIGLAALGAAVAVGAGAVLGAALGWTAALLLARSQVLHPPEVALATSSVRDAVPTLAILASVAVVLVTAVLAWPASAEGTAWHVIELLAVVNLAAAALVAARGAVGVATVGDDPLSLALPVLGLAAAALVAARLWVPVAVGVSRRLPSRAVAGRLAAAGSVRRPLRTVVPVGFLTAAVGSVVFAGAYRATLQDGAADTAAFDVPLGARLTVGAQGDDPVPLLAQSSPTSPTFAVVRSVAGVRTSATSADAVTVLGVDTAALPHMGRWDRTVGALSPDEVGRLLGAHTAATGVALLEDETTLSIPVRSWTRKPAGRVEVVAWLTAADGREYAVKLEQVGSSLVGHRRDHGTGWRLTALTLREDPTDAARREHRVGEGTTVFELLSGRLVLAGSRDQWATWSSRSAAVSATGGDLAIDYRLAGPLVVVRPGLADRAAVPVAVDPVTAQRGTTVRIDLGGGDSVAARVVATLPRFPTTGARFVVSDRTAIAEALDDAAPGSGAPHEVWAVTQPGDDIDAARAPYDRLVVLTQASRRAALETDAVAQGAGWLLLVAAALGLLVSVVALVLLVVGERDDDAGQLLAQEADGVSTSTLRRSLWWRAVAAAVPALLLGVVAGLLLARSVTSLLALSASGTTPSPPLQPAVGAAWTTAVVGAGLVAALLVCAVVASRMLRSAWPVAVDQDLR